MDDANYDQDIAPVELALEISNGNGRCEEQGCCTIGCSQSAAEASRRLALSIQRLNEDAAIGTQLGMNNRKARRILSNFHAFRLL
jgi:hypothetical protein